MASSTLQSQDNSLREPLLADPEQGKTLESVEDSHGASTGVSGKVRNLCAVAATVLLYGLAVLSSKSLGADPFHPLKYGKVVYLEEETPEGRLYYRDITSPCMYGILTFAVAPAART